MTFDVARSDFTKFVYAIMFEAFGQHFDAMFLIILIWFQSMPSSRVGCCVVGHHCAIINHDFSKLVSNCQKSETEIMFSEIMFSEAVQSVEM